MAKALFDEAGIRTPRGVDVPAGAGLTDDQIDQVVESLGLPLFVKPAANGSSFGISRVTSRAALNDAIAAAGSAGGRVLIEECVSGTEITVPVIGNDDPHALPIVEIVTGAEFYDLKVKYEPSSLHHVIPARLDPGVYAKAQQIAVAASQRRHLPAARGKHPDKGLTQQTGCASKNQRFGHDNLRLFMLPPPLAGVNSKSARLATSRQLPYTAAMKCAILLVAFGAAGRPPERISRRTA